MEPEHTLLDQISFWESDKPLMLSTSSSTPKCYYILLASLCLSWTSIVFKENFASIHITDVNPILQLMSK